jgi:hypothetical protein
MILADENIHSFIIKTLREANFQVISVSEISKGIKLIHHPGRQKDSEEKLSFI